VDAFEYAIRKDVRNNPIIREVDEERQRALWRSALIVAFLTAAALFWAWQRAQLLSYGYEMQELLEQQAAEHEELRRLTLEYEMLRSLPSLRTRASQLGFVAPSMDDAFIVERAAPAAPDRSIVARR
jgi:hypothetical protein